MNSARSHFIFDSFFTKARRLRGEFESRFLDPKKSDSDRFVWDYWHIPEQYTLMRTPAYHYFSPALYRSFHEALLKIAREEFGCFDITPPWLSYYVEGCEQELHADVPHGPWAYVFSLTPWKNRKFTGGETILLKPATLDYWNHLGGFHGVEKPDLVEKIPALFNRLLVFDPRIPHGVAQVRGTQNPLHARLVIHGWFKEPRPYIVGPLTRKQATAGVNELIQAMVGPLESVRDLHGTLTLQVTVAKTGLVQRIQILTQTLKSPSHSEAELKKKIHEGFSLMKTVRFSKASGATRMTIPFLFR